MALRQILPCTDPLMRQVSTEITEIDEDLLTLAHDMLHTMLTADGAGLAAVQVGVPVRMFTMLDLPNGPLPTQSMLPGLAKLVLINPVIIDRSDDMVSLPEGCLSMPGVFFDVSRHREVTVEYSDVQGERQTLYGSGYKAICIQHELDHLDGIRNIDRVSSLKRSMLLKKFASHRRSVRLG
ncbi:peptide deformylase [Brevundimonas phage vB_BpoS-Gurke]|uniref:Peptide deformylase n=1 Tax=Brevundimonas phage vB_BpoS-Gurke TaxID=2948599 RepID=A0A9E7N204_9CAUD|nr:peptide deformylase [Brevundimonas phage vB_BpoS-Gurke]